MSGSTARPRWFTQTPAGHSRAYIERFRALAEEGADLEGEARFVDALARPRSRVLDAGCGPGRLGGALHRRGHEVVGVDVDPELVAQARVDHPGPRWHVADLADLDLGERFDVVVSAGNVMVFLAPGTEAEVVRRLAAHTTPEDGALVLGFRLDRHYGLADLDADLAAAGCRVEQRFATWDLRPWTPDADFAITLARRVSGS